MNTTPADGYPSFDEGLACNDEFALYAWEDDGGFVLPEGGGETKPVNGGAAPEVRIAFSRVSGRKSLSADMNNGSTIL